MANMPIISVDDTNLDTFDSRHRQNFWTCHDRSQFLTHVLHLDIATLTNGDTWQRNVQTPMQQHESKIIFEIRGR